MSFYQTRSDSCPDDAALLFRCLLEGRYAEAFLLMPALESTDAADVLFNMALVYRRMEEEPRAVSFLERALAALQRVALKLGFSAPAAYTRLRASELENSVSAPMNAEYVRAFPAQARENILLALIACYTSMGMPGKADALTAGLAGHVFAEYKTNLKEKQKHGGV